MLSSRLVVPSSIFSMIFLSCSIFVSYVSVMVYTLHDHLAVPVVKPDLHAVTLRHLVHAPYDHPVLLRHAVPPGEDRKGAPAEEGCLQFCQDQTFALDPRAGCPAEAVGQVSSCSLPLLEFPGKPEGAEPVPEFCDLLLCTCEPGLQCRPHPAPEFFYPGDKDMPVGDDQFGSSRRGGS